MEKNKDVRVFMLCHKEVPYGLIDNEIITPLECGAAVVDNNVCELKDNQGEDNISEYNFFYLEDTAMYWIWKYVNDCKYKGQMHYRRRIDLSRIYDFDELFKHYDIIVSEPIHLHCTVREHYNERHIMNDLLIIEDIIEESYPEYKETYETYIANDNRIFSSNMFVLPTEEYNKYCEFLFEILGKYVEKLGMKRDETLKTDIREYVQYALYQKEGELPNEAWLTYQMRTAAYLAERIFTMYVFHHFPNRFTIPYVKMEDGMEY